MTTDDDDKKPPNFPVAMVVEISAVGSVPATQIPALQEIANQMLEDLVRRFSELAGAKVYPRWSEARPATRDELLNFIPRKTHYTIDGFEWACDTAHVARRNLVRDPPAVTCKLCRKILAQRGLISEELPPLAPRGALGGT